MVFRTLRLKNILTYFEDTLITEETFGGIWIEDTEEFAKFVSAVNTYPADENGEGIAKTSDYLYLYYRGIGERIIPFASVYLNKGESQNVANELINAWNNGEKGKVREYIDGAYEVARYVNVQGNILDGTDKELSATRGNDRLGGELSRHGRYYDYPSLYSKVKRADRGNESTRINYSIRELDAPYLDAVERGDMETAQEMVLEAAKRAMPNTMVVDENGNPKVVYHGDRKKTRYIFSTDTFFTPTADYARRYIMAQARLKLAMYRSALICLWQSVLQALQRRPRMWLVKTRYSCVRVRRWRWRRQRM